MGYRKTSSELYAKAWEEYQLRCRKDGFIALSQYCQSIGMKVQRLYEWLRRRKISLYDFHEELCEGRHVVEESSREVSFCQVEIAEAAYTTGKGPHSDVLEVRFDLRSGDRVNVGGVSPDDLAYLMKSLNAGSNVGS